MRQEPANCPGVGLLAHGTLRPNVPPASPPCGRTPCLSGRVPRTFRRCVTTPPRNASSGRMAFGSTRRDVDESIGVDPRGRCTIITHHTRADSSGRARRRCLFEASIPLEDAPLRQPRHAEKHRRGKPACTANARALVGLAPCYDVAKNCLDAARKVVTSAARDDRASRWTTEGWEAPQHATSRSRFSANPDRQSQPEKRSA
jgi:hypothetical protein